MINLFLALIIPIVIGAMVFSIKDFKLPFEVKLLLSAPLGFGTTSMTYFLWIKAFNGNHLNYYPWFEATVILGLIIAYILHRRFYMPNIRFYKFDIANTLYSIFLMLSIFMFLGAVIDNPLGSWDGWRIWNTKAMFLFHGNELWTNIFKMPHILSHTDYPLFLPCSVSRIWTYMGHDSYLAPILLALIFTFATPILLYKYFRVTRILAIAASSTLFGSFLYIHNGASLAADIPLSLFYLSAFISFGYAERFSDARLYAIAGIFAGLSAWCKNEGFLFALICAFLVTMVYLMRKNFRAIKLFILGNFITLAFVLYFKITSHASNDLITGLQLIDIKAQLLNYSSYLLIIKSFMNTILTTPLVCMFLVFVLLFRPNPYQATKTTRLIATLAVAAMLLGYGFAYILSPHELVWHLNSSMDRLVCQLLPIIIFIFFGYYRGYAHKFKKNPPIE